MKWLIGFVSYYFGTFLTWLVKKFSYATVAFVLAKSVQIFLVAVVFAMLAFFFAFYLQIWNTFSSFITDFNNMTVADGASVTYGGITISNIMENAKGFIYYSGLSDAIVTSGNLLIAFLSFKLGAVVWRLYMKLQEILYKIFMDGISFIKPNL